MTADVIAAHRERDLYSFVPVLAPCEQLRYDDHALWFRDSRLPDIISDVRYSRVIAIGAVLAFVAACSPGTEKRRSEQLPVNPRPTAPGQTVVLGGNGQLTGKPKDGAYAVQTPLVPVGSVAAAPDGSIYVPVKTSSKDSGTTQIARITADGRLHLIGPQMKWGLNDKLAAHGDKLWILSSMGPQQSLKKLSLDGKFEEKYFDTASDADLTFIDTNGEPLDRSRLESTRKRWRTLANNVAVAITFRTNGTPVVALRSGELYEALGHGKMQAWDPPGYSAARKDLVNTASGERPGHSNFLPGEMTQDTAGGFFVASNAGVIRIPTSGNAIGIRFPSRLAGIPWTGGTTLADHSLLLASRFDHTREATLIRVSKGASTEVVNADFRQYCHAELTPAFSGMTKGSEAMVIIADKGCGRIYGLRLS